MSSSKFVVFALAAGFASAASAQMETYRWTDACHNTVRYDRRKIDRRILENTIQILNDADARVPISPLVSSPTDIARLDPAAFERDCRAQAARMRAAQLLPVPGIEEFRAMRARHVDDACLFGAAKMRGYSEPSALRTYPRASPHCDVYVDALEGKTDMNALWRQRIVEDCRDNASPSACVRRDEERGAGPDGEAWKRLYLTDYSWNNCAIEHTDFNSEETKRTETWERLNRAFRKTYGVKRRCNEP